MLALAIMLSLGVPIPAFAEEIVAENNEIYAILYYIDSSLMSGSSINNNKNIELVFQKGDARDPAKTVVTDKNGNPGIFSIANDATAYTGSGTVPATPWFSFSATSSNQNITRVDFKDKVKPEKIDGWLRNCRYLEWDNILHKENLDTSECESMLYTFQSCNKFTTFDFSQWPNLDFSNVQKMNYLFGECTSLHTIDLSGIDPVNCSNCSYMFYKNTALTNVKLGSFKAGNNVRKSTGSSSDGVSLYRIFSGCTNLETVDTSELELNFPNNTAYMFENCSSLIEIDLSRMYGNTPRDGFSTNMTGMFKNCTSLEVINLNLFPHTLGYAHIEEIFTGCDSLREFYLEDAKATNKQYNSNIFADTDNLSYVAITPNWAANTNWVPKKTTWTKVKAAKVPQSGEVPVGTELSNVDLFKNFQKIYAGTWAAATDFEFNACGGTAVVDGKNEAIQFVPGAKDMPLNYDGIIVTPTRAGYSFNGWHKSKNEDSPFASGEIADRWTYYAHWTDNTYKLILNANGGYIDGSQDTRIEYDNLKYSEPKKLDGNAFVNDDGKILVGWNTNPRGTGTSFAPDDSVSMLTPTDGGEVTLYAIWYVPDAIVSFDAQGGSEVDDIHYSLPNDFGSLSESQRTSYTFLGWFTEAEGGTKIEEDTPVTGSCTVYAHWERNPIVTFDAGEGCFDGDETKKTEQKVYKYGANLGVTPTPEKGTATFLGWFREGSNDPVPSGFEINEDLILSARWSYVPYFDTYGGVISGTMPDYEPQIESTYTITELPEVKKENFTFLGWKHGDDWIWQAGDSFPASGITVDLASDNRIKAVWDQKDYVTVTLDPNSGSLKSGEINPIRVYEGSPIAALPNPTREGYDFEGWYIGNTKYTTESTFSEDVTLTARWSRKNLTVTFNAGDGVMDDGTSKTKTVKVVQNKPIASIPGAYYVNPLTGGLAKSFGGWFTQPNGQGQRLTADTAISSNTTYYAYWVNNMQTSEDYDYSFSVQWNDKSSTTVTDLGDRLVYHPINGGDLTANLRVIFENQGTGAPIPQNAVKIKIPKYIFKDWSNKPIIKCNADKAISEGFELLDVNTDPDYYIFNNKSELSGTDAVFNIIYTFNPVNINGGYTDENGYFHDGFINNDINVKIEVDVDGDGNLETDYTKNLAVEMHTKVDTTVSKVRSNVSLLWNSKWGAKPADSDDYFYVEWKLNSNHAYSNYNQKFYLLWDENTVRDEGTVVYADKYVAHGDTAGTYTGIQSNGQKSYTVVTKHRKDSARMIGGDQWAEVSNEAILNVKWQSGYIEQFRTSATTTAYIPPAGSGDYSFNKAVPDKDTNESHFKHGGQELVTNREAENMPKLPYEITYREAANSDDPTWNATTARYTAKKRTITLTDGVSGDVVISNNNGNYSTDSWAGSTALDDSDYYFDSLKLTVTEFDASKLGDSWSNPYEHTPHTNYGQTQIWVRKANSNTFTLHRELVVTESDTVVNLPADTVGFKIIHESEFFSTNLEVKTNLCLKPTAKLAALVTSDIQNNLKTLIKNKSLLTVECDGNTRSYDSSNSTWPCTYVLDLSSTQLISRKSCASQDNVEVDPSTMSEIVPAVVSGWSYNNSGNKKRFTTGEIYDLLPKDFSVDKNSVYVKPILENWTEKNYEDKKITGNKYDSETASGTLSKSCYSVRFEQDWKGSGRTMMIVRVNVPDSIFATGVSVWFKMKTLYANIYINDVTQINMSAFIDTTENSLPPESRTSKLEDNAIAPEFKSCFEDLDSDRTAFASANVNCVLPPIHESGIDSTVLAGSIASKHRTVAPDTDYKYYINYGSGVSGVTQNLVFYDVIEHRFDGLESEWEGDFEGVDVSSITKIVNALDPEACCAPVVYYAVKTGENAKPKDSFVLNSNGENDDFDLDNNIFWTTELPENLNDVTAVAVDCRYDDKGNPFALKPESTIGFEINMHSKRELDENDIYTYNEAVIRFMLLDHRTTQRTQTDVLLHFGTPELAKAAFPSSGTEENPAAVVKNSILEYTLNVTNTDTEVQITDITVNDTLDATKLRIDETNLAVKVGDGDETPIGRSVHIKSYELTRVGDEYRFSAVIASIDELETVSIIIPVTVIGEKDETIVNQADISAIYGAEFIVNSNPTYHIIDDPQVKVLKVNSKDEPLEGATLTILNDDSSESQAVIHDAQGNTVTSFTSGADILSFSIMPGRYILRELSTPNDEIYKKADDIKFRIDSDGFAYINGVKNDIIKMVNEPKYKVVFHENNPESNDKNVVFRIYEPNDLDQNKMIAHFYDIPKWAGDEYVFAGWYHNSGYTETTEGIDTPSNFEQDSYPARDGDYHLYAKWIKVGTVSKDSNDANLMNGDYRGFGLEGVQIRNPEMYDSNYETVTPGGMRFVTSLKESLLSEIDALSSKKVSTSEGNVDVEYGYAVGTEKNIKTFTSHYGITDPNNYQMQYKGENVNGINTTGKDRTPETDFRFITNVNCTRGTTNADGTIKEDHRNFANYRLYTLVVTYEGNSAGSKNEKLAARSYIRYYDANGKLRVFYNTYKKSMYGGCMCSFNQVAGMAIPQNQEMLAEQQTP